MNREKNGAKKEVASSRKLKRIREVSIFVAFFERLFFFLQFLTPEKYFCKSRSQIQNECKEHGERRNKSKIRSIEVEWFILGWIFIEIASPFILESSAENWIVHLLFLLIVVRIVAIFQTAINISLFDNLRIEAEDHYIKNFTRSITLSLVNILELILCFGFVYAVCLKNGMLKGPDPLSISDGYYFSGITQLTIGYGDIRPIGIVRFIAVGQGLVSLILTVLLLGRFISYLPKMKEE